VENIGKIKKNGMFVMEPDVGLMACGTRGEGRFPEVERIYGFIMKHLPETDSFFSLKKAVIAIGGTSEDIDPVRCITNRSSGKMGFSFAEEFIKRGADIRLVVGNVSDLLLHNFTARYPDVGIIRVRSSSDMKETLIGMQDDFDVLFMPAAPADYSPDKSEEKIKKTSDILELKLHKTADILSSLEKRKNAIYVGFTAESVDLEKNARMKLEKKGMDFVIGNIISGDRSAMGGDKAELILLNKWNTTVDRYEYADKSALAAMVLDRLEELIRQHVPGML
jgi:phosphopantothenoylcysteine decarboxylase/phosphopantothenate--cysteine ligase